MRVRYSHQLLTLIKGLFGKFSLRKFIELSIYGYMNPAQFRRWWNLNRFPSIFRQSHKNWSLHVLLTYLTLGVWIYFRWAWNFDRLVMNSLVLLSRKLKKKWWFGKRLSRVLEDKKAIYNHFETSVSISKKSKNKSRKSSNSFSVVWKPGRKIRETCRSPEDLWCRTR